MSAKLLDLQCLNVWELLSMLGAELVIGSKEGFWGFHGL
jgi:hypothetical protein